MSLAKITLTGQEMMLQTENKSVFDLLSLPTGIDKDNLVDNILLECGEFEVLYSDAYFMRSAVGSWSDKHYRTFEKWIEALNIEYNPLENYDRIEDFTVTRNKHDSLEDETTGSSNVKDKGSTETKVSAFDSSDYQPSDKTDVDNTTDTTSAGNLKHKGEEHEGTKHTGRLHGNIGVTTSQQMLQSELDIARFNIINEITKLFMTELCICVYE